MTDLLSVLAIAKRLQIPESTARYYARKFDDFLPSVGEGRQKRYREGAIKIIQIIADMAKENKSSDDIAKHLSQQFPINTGIINNEPQQVLASYQQQDLPAIFKDLLATHIEVINQSLTKDRQLLEQTVVIEQKNKELDEQKEKVSAQNRVLKEAGEKIRELQNEVERLRTPWWKRLFGR
jgi:DNA-binding transcriptional MerR regulator